MAACRHPAALQGPQDSRGGAAAAAAVRRQGRVLPEGTQYVLPMWHVRRHGHLIRRSIQWLNHWLVRLSMICLGTAFLPSACHLAGAISCCML